MFHCPRCRTEYEDPPAFCGTCGERIPGKESLVPPPADPLVGLIIDGRYRIVDMIGRGGMGAVYRVEHVKIGKIMAMKILHGELSQDRDLARRFKREAETVSRLTHMHTVSVFDFGDHHGMNYLVMEYIDGQDLSQVLRASGPLPFSRTAGILIQVCSALQEAHAMGIVHRDLKPENILVARRNEQDDFVKVLDFGLAQLRNVGEKSKLTAQGSLVGTPYYMAPEHIRGEGVDQRTDVYAIGAVMYKLLSGETPFSANTPIGVIAKHLKEEPERPSERFPKLKIPKIADTIVLKAMSKDPKDRYASVNEMRSVLTDTLKKTYSDMDLRRLSIDDSNWNLGKELIPPTNGWSSTAFDRTVLKEKEKGKSRQTLGPDTGLNANLSKSIIIGVREVEIGTKADFEDFESSLKHKRLMSTAIGIVALLAAVAAVLYFVLFSHRDDSNPTLETEPNDAPGQADTLGISVELAGFIAGSQPAGDIDWYRLPGPGVIPWAVEVEVSGVPGLDMALQLVDPSAKEPIYVSNRNGQGKKERIAPMVIQKPDVYLMLQEVRAPGIPPGSFQQQAYQVVYRMYNAAFFEIEPNNTVSQATPVQLGAGMNGTLSPDEKVDWYCQGAGNPVKAVQVSGTKDVDMALTLRLGPSAQPIEVNNRGKGEGESVSLPKGPGPTCVGVKQLQTQDAGPSPGLEASYQILFQ